MIKSPYRIKWYFSGLALISLFLIVINYIVIPKCVPVDADYKEPIVSFFNNMIALSISGIVASWALLFFTPRTLKNSDIDIINPHDIKFMLEKLVFNTERFCYLGHTARWNRSVTLEKLRSDAEFRKIRKEISLVILDPNDIPSCQYYCDFGHSNRNKGNNISNINDVRSELLTTILTCIKYQKSPFLDISLFVTNKVSLFRLDISDSAILLTKPYSDEPALHFPQDTFFYSSYKEEFKIVRDQSRKINLDVNISNLTAKNFVQLIEISGVTCDGMEESLFEEIINQSKKLDSPY